jgi:hypothetical protein
MTTPHQPNGDMTRLFLLTFFAGVLMGVLLYFIVALVASRFHDPRLDIGGDPVMPTEMKKTEAGR